MSQQKFLFFYGLIAVFFTLMFLRLKLKKDRPTSLNLRKIRSSQAKNVEVNNEEELNIYFSFQGKMWDAYEVIGVPAGSSMAEVENAYTKASNQDNPSEEILDKAYKAIHKKLSHTKNL